MDKIDTSVEEEAVKDDARQFMSCIIPMVGEPVPAASVAISTDGAEIMKSWKATYAAATSNKNDGESLMEKFWSIYDPGATSIWTMVYDEADDNESLDETVALVDYFMKQSGMASITNHCFGIVHALESLEIEGLWFFNGPNPEQMFAANKESSWYTWYQLGPEANDYVKDAVARIMMPTDSKLNGKIIKDTKVFL